MPHNSFFEATLLQFWRAHGIIYFCSGELKRSPFITHLRLRFWDATCDAQGGSTKKHRSPSSRHELCRCAGEIHIFVEFLWPKFGLVQVTQTSDSSWWVGFVEFRLKGFTIDEHHDWRASLSSWMVFGHSAACLVSASRKLFVRGYRRWLLKWSHHVLFEWNMNWLFIIEYCKKRKCS